MSPDGGSAPYSATFEKSWWENRWLLIALLLLMAVPLLGPAIPPLTDLPGHLGRYRVQLDLPRSPALQAYYAFDWALIGNLGVDLLVEALAPLMGLEPAVKLVVTSIPVLTAAGALLVAREVHGRLPPTVFFALPLAYNYPFLFGFVNFALSMALALLGLGLWLRLDRQGRYRLRALLFVPLSLLLWTAHAFGWGMLGATALSAEVVRAWDRGQRSAWKAIWRGGLAVLPLTPPFLLMLIWRSEGSGITGDWFDWTTKLSYLGSALRDRWLFWDATGLAILVVLLLVTLFSKRLAWSRNLAASGLFLALIFVLLPRILFGSAYADMRLAPYLFLVALLAIRLAPAADPRFATGLALAGLLFTGARVAGNTVSSSGYDAAFRRELAAVAHIRPGSAVLALVGKPCETTWEATRLDHLPSVALARRQVMVNDQWVMPGAQLLRVRYTQARPFLQDPTQIVTSSACPNLGWRTIGLSLRHVPGAFDYLWLIRPPAYERALLSGWRPVWRDGSSLLLQRQRSSATSDTPTGSDTRPTR